MNIDHNPTSAGTLRGFFKINVVNPDTGEVRDFAFENLLLDGGLNGIGANTMLALCCVGSGSTAPINTNTQLEALVASTTSVGEDTGGDPSGYGWIRRSFSFGAGVAAGNLSEIGIGHATNILLSRTLIKDGDGNPTSITVLSNEFFNVLYELRLYPPVGDTAFDVVLMGVNTHCVIRASEAGTNIWAPYAARDNSQAGNAHGSNVVFYDGALGPVTGQPSGDNSQVGNLGFAAYVNNSLQIASGGPIVGLGLANFVGGITAMSYRTGMGAFQVSFDPPILKDGSKTMTVNQTTTWARAA